MNLVALPAFEDNYLWLLHDGARALVEHRLTDHWRIGGRVDIQQADDYAPSHATLFLRYTFKPWRGDLDMPPLPLTPYAEFD